MGALHKGHLTLVEQSKKQSDISILSIFVNPTQFNDKKDLERYPRTLGNDVKLLTAVGCDVLFYPDEEEMYPFGEAQKQYELNELETLFEGAFRPGHFQGVCQIVDKLFTIITPDKVFFGQKDYQQCMVIKKLLKLNPSFGQIEMNIIPTVREDNGLAMSSRNQLLSIEEKQVASTLHDQLLFIKKNIKNLPLSELLSKAELQLIQKGFKPEYISVANAEDLSPINNLDGNTSLVALVAAYLGKVRLIDNMLIN